MHSARGDACLRPFSSFGDGGPGDGCGDSGRGGQAFAVGADLGVGRAAATHILEAACNEFGTVDLLVNNASIFEPGRLAETTPEEWQRHMEINLAAPLWLCQGFAEQVGAGATRSIVNILDWRALRPPAGHLAYTVSKAGLACLTRMLALELAPSIRVNGIAPGAILPPPGATLESFAALEDNIPLQRTGGPVDVVQALLFLVQSEFITGEIIHVTGGQQL